MHMSHNHLSNISHFKTRAATALHNAHQKSDKTISGKAIKAKHTETAVNLLCSAHWSSSHQ